MPRKPAKKIDEILEDIEKVGSTVSKEISKRKKKDATTTKKASKSSEKKSTEKSKTTKKSNAPEKSKTTKSSTKRATKSGASKRATKAEASKKVTRKNTAKKVSTRTNKKATIAKENVTNIDEITASTNLTKKIEVLEYYDLPYRYNQTVVKVLAQTPTTLFIYWDISDIDRKSFIDQYGENFFNYTKPVLIIHNNTMHYSFEVEIDDFANSWYLHVNDSNCEYVVELGRRAKYYNEERHVDIPQNYLHVTSSNVIDSPNDHVLFDRNIKTVYFKDIKTNIVTAKDITSISFLRNMGRIYNLYDLQSDFTKTDWIKSNLQLDLKNPTSANPSSTFR